MPSNHPDSWMTLDDSIAGFIKKDPEFLSKLNKAHEQLEVGHQIFLIRERLKMSRKRFGRVLGISENDVLKLEYGDLAEPPCDVLKKILIDITMWLTSVDEHRSTSSTSRDRAAMVCKTSV